MKLIFKFLGLFSESEVANHIMILLPASVHSVPQCKQCSALNTCTECLQTFQCGWCGDYNNPTIGK